MTVIKDMHVASFRRVRFLVSSETVMRGKKTVMHEYPNSDQRYVEELGKLPPTFSLTAIVHGDDAITQRFRLENALEQRGLGTLVHPIYGELKVAVLNFSVSSNQTSVGQFVFDIQFAQSRENISPSPGTPTNQSITNLAQDAKDKANDQLVSLYKAPTTPSVFDSVVSTVEGVASQVREKVQGIVEKTSAGAAGFDRVYRSITRNISYVVSSAQTLRDNLTLLYDTALDVPVLVDQLAAAWDDLVDYPFTVATSPITSIQEQRDQNNTSIIEHMRLTALANSYESKSYASYTTDTELFAAIERLNNVYNDFFTAQNQNLTDLGLVSIADGTDVRSAFAELRVTARRVFDEKEKIVYRVVDINPGLTSLAMTTYRYYGSLDLLDEMTTLNQAINIATFNQTIKALTE